MSYGWQAGKERSRLSCRPLAGSSQAGQANPMALVLSRSLSQADQSLFQRHGRTSCRNNAARVCANLNHDVRPGNRTKAKHLLALAAGATTRELMERMGTPRQQWPCVTSTCWWHEPRAQSQRVRAAALVVAADQARCGWR